MRLAPWLAALMLLAACKKKEEGAATPTAGRPAPTAAPARAACEGKPERKLSSGSVGGRFLGVQVGGDRTRVLLRTTQGRTESFQASDETAWFLVAHRKRPLEVRYDELETCLAETGGYARVLRIEAARAGELSQEAWWAKVSRDAAARAAVQEQFRAYVEGPFGR
jgi:hypothetical protein